MCAKKKKTKSKKKHVQRLNDSLPALDSLSGIPSFDKLVITDTQISSYEDICSRAISLGEASSEELELGRVVRLDRGFPAIVSSTGLYRAEFATTLSKAKGTVAVGDWVCVRRPANHDMSLILGVCTRKSELSRWRGGARAERQVLVANADSVLITHPLGEREFVYDRIVRSVVVAYDCNMSAGIILTKADLLTPSDLKDNIRVLQEVLEGIDIVVTCDRHADIDDATKQALIDATHACGCMWGVEAVKKLVPSGTSAILLGESGAGKSTLLNSILGKQALETGSVRSKDGAGRHTTVARRMVNIDDAGIIIDAPGLRSLPVLGHERGLAKTFPQISVHASECKFRDCTHVHEPGCEVRLALDNGEYSTTCLNSYLLLADEMRKAADNLDPDIVL